MAPDDEAGIDVVLVGDSATSTVYGYPTSLTVTVDELISLARAVASSVKRALVMGDLPFGPDQASPEQAYVTASRFLKEAGVAAVKLEGGAAMAPQMRRLAQGGIPVCAHIGFTPQYEHALGGTFPGPEHTVEPARVQIDLSRRAEVCQQHGYVHAGATSAIADGAGGYAALTLMPASCEVLTVDYKLNLLSPAAADPAP